MKLIPEWRKCHKMWSIRLGVLGSAIIGFVTAFPDAAVQAWNLVPGELKAFIPEQYLPLVGVAVFVASLLARLVRQSDLHKDTEDGPSER